MGLEMNAIILGTAPCMDAKGKMKNSKTRIPVWGGLGQFPIDTYMFSLFLDSIIP